MSDMLARNIKWYRQQKRMTQQQLADAVGISLMSIRRYEMKGKSNREPKIDILDKIAFTLDTTSDILRGKVSNYEFKDAQTGKPQNLEITEQWIEHKEKEKLDNNFKKANIEGKKKIVDYASDIVENPKYRKDTKE
ncbi:MAG: helix-turn-helix transcriptional regulator [Lachnospiraceae bacterium]|nr:helix-turn-helix transcriptional regulator [Lachnospiraceae bacterium]